MSLVHPFIFHSDRHRSQRQIKTNVLKAPGKSFQTGNDYVKNQRSNKIINIKPQLNFTRATAPSCTGCPLHKGTRPRGQVGLKFSSLFASRAEALVWSCIDWKKGSLL